MYMSVQTSPAAPMPPLYVSAVGNPYFFTGRRLHLIEDFRMGGEVQDGSNSGQ